MDMLAFDVGGTFIKYAIINELGEITEQGKVQTPKKNQEAFLSSLQEIFDLWKNKIKGIAVSLPGTIDSSSGYIIQGGALPYNANTNLKKLMQEKFNVPVEIQNDAKCAATAELACGNLQGIKNGVVLTFGTGIGGCLIIDGILHHGSHFFAGEVSMTITKDIRKHGGDGVWGSRMQGSVPGLIERICEEKKVQIEDGQVVFSWIEQHDKIANDIFQEYCYQIVVQLFNIQVLIDPQRICIGGGISKNPIFVTSIKKALDVFYGRLPISVPKMEIMSCKFHNDANLIGAVQHFKHMQETYSAISM